MEILIYIFIVIVLILNIRNIFTFTNLWFLKEYRLDRMLIHLKTSQGKKILFSEFKIPPKNFKSIVILSIFLLILTSSLFFEQKFTLIFNLVFFILLFPFTGVVVFLLSIPTRIYHHQQISMAKNKLSKFPELKIVGITGSYGKTSTKEYLYEILKNKFNVLKTDASINSLIGISELINNKLDNNHEILILEMGAYKIGEIRKMCNLARPNVSIVTAVNSQHQDLFGSIQNTQKAKYEIIEMLDEEGFAIINYDNDYTREMIGWANRDNKKVWLYSANDFVKLKYDNLFQINNISSDLKGINFELINKNKKYIVFANILGDHQAYNLTAAISAACCLGMSLEEVLKITPQIKHLNTTLKPTPGYNGALFINDTFNNNPEAAIAAVNVLRIHKTGKKILVFQPMIELGAYSKKEHVKVFDYIARHVDYIFITNNNFSDYIKEGISLHKNKAKCEFLTPIQISKRIKEIISKNDIVLFKGKEAKRALDLLI